jgi:hypothetical protein
MKAIVIEGVLNKLQVKSKPNKLYMFIGRQTVVVDSMDCWKILVLTDQLRNHNDENTPMTLYPYFIAFMSSIRRMKSNSNYNYTWKCPSSNFLYVVIRAIESYNNVTNLELGQCIDLILEKVESVLVMNRVARHDFLMEKKKHS